MYVTRPLSEQEARTKSYQSRNVHSIASLQPRKPPPGKNPTQTSIVTDLEVNTHTSKNTRASTRTKTYRVLEPMVRKYDSPGLLFLLHVKAFEREHLSCPYS